MPSSPLLLPDEYFLINTKFRENIIEETERVIANRDKALIEVPEPPEIELIDCWYIYFLSTIADEIVEDNYINNNALNEKNNWKNKRWI